MLKIFGTVPALLFTAIMAQQPAPVAAVPAQAAAASNPVKPTPESLAHARTLYRMDCAICHGQKGDGKGDVVEELKLKMKDFTDPAVLKERSDGELFYIIKNGDPALKMPAEGPRAKDDDLWALVNYLRTFQR